MFCTCVCLLQVKTQIEESNPTDVLIMIVKVNHENLTYHLWENGYKINKKNFEVIPPNHYKIISIFFIFI